MSNHKYKKIKMSSLWRQAVFAFTLSEKNIVWYHVDYITSNSIDITAIHNYKQYTKKINDNFVWLRS